MYSSAIAQRRLDLQMDALRQQYPHIEMMDVPDPEMLARLDAVWAPHPTGDWKKGEPSRNLNAEEHQFILREIVHCKADVRYWLRHYARIKDKDGRSVAPYPLLDSQDIMMNKLGKLEDESFSGQRRDGLLLANLKARQVGMCLDGETRVLKSDLTWDFIKNIREDDELIAVDEFPLPNKAGRLRGVDRKMRTARVEAVNTTFKPAFRLVFEDGTSVTATKEHRFLSKDPSNVVRTKMLWRSVGEMKPGDSIRGLCKTWDNIPTYEDGWMGGIIDGEGHFALASRSGAAVNISQVFGPVHSRITEYLTREGYNWRQDIDRRTPGENGTSKLGSKDVARIMISRMSDVFRLLGKTRPTRVGNRRWWEGKGIPGKKTGADWRKIVRIEHLPEQVMYDIQTSEKTFIAEGLISHNSTLTELLILHRTVFYGNLYALIAADVEEQSANLFDMTERSLRALPWWMRPRITNHVKDAELNFGDIDSMIRVTYANTTRGGAQIGFEKGQMGRGSTVHLFHGSEMSTWTNASQVDDALLPAIPRSANTLAVLESTARGRNWWYKTWLSAKAGESRWVPVFIPWYAEGRYREIPPSGWVPLEDTIRHAVYAEEISAQWCGKTIHLDREQLYFWEKGYLGAKKDHKLFKFLAEYSADDETCFRVSDDGFFDGEAMLALRQKARPPIGLLSLN